MDWMTNDDFGLSELREFFEAPFFRRWESLRFYRWLGEEGVHEGAFRGSRISMSVGHRRGMLAVRIQWWTPVVGSDPLQSPGERNGFWQGRVLAATHGGTLPRWKNLIFKQFQSIAV